MDMVPKEAFNQGKIEAISAKDVEFSRINRFLDQVMKVEESAWPEELRASREKFLSRLTIFPEGLIALKINDQIKGVSTSQISYFSYYDSSGNENYTWENLTDNGTIKSTHDHAGNALYIISIGVSEDVQGQGLGGKLLDEQKKLAQDLGLKYLFLGARIPGYKSYLENNGQISVEDYLKSVTKKGEPIDPEIRFYYRQGLRPVRVVPNFEPDEQSLNFGVVMVSEVSGK
jgi:GNAT superfamily N-acetyltransferase